VTSGRLTSASVLLKGGTVVLPEGVKRVDVLIVDGLIVDVSQDISSDGVPIEDVTGLTVLPGAIDPHVHFGWPGAADDFETGSLAAACGGTTCVVEYAIQFPGDSLASSVPSWKSMGRSSVVDYGLHAIVSDSRRETLATVASLVAEGVSSFKMFMTSQHSGGLGVDDATLFSVFRQVGKSGGIGMAHCENDLVIQLLGAELIEDGVSGPIGHSLSRPPFVEAEAVQRAIVLAAAAGCPFYVPHLSSAAALTAVRQARERGCLVLAETCPQFLALTDEVYESRHGERFVMSPPIKSASDRDALWDGLVSGPLVTVGSDHCPYPATLKEANSGRDFRLIPNGVPGVETLLPIMYGLGVSTGKISLTELATITAANPAKIFGMYDRKGSIAPGKDGDVVVIDSSSEMDLTATHLHSAIDYSIFDSITVPGRPVLTVGRGEIIARNGQYTGGPGRGRFVARYSPDVAMFGGS
jgi:dihydropyrimidinase